MSLHSQVQLFEPDHRLAWTGTAWTAKAIHLWTLQATPGGHTTVSIRESMDGPLLGSLYSSDDLAAAGRAWLQALKRAAEQPSPAFHTP